MSVVHDDPDFAGLIEAVTTIEWLRRNPMPEAGPPEHDPPGDGEQD